MPGTRPSGAVARGRWGVVPALLGLGVLALLLTGCPVKTGTYAPLDWAYEMHYSQSYRSQEPPRLTPPDGAVPFKFASAPRAYTRDVEYTEEQLNALSSPVERTPETLAQGRELYRVNCSFCHGDMGKGDGPVSAKLAENGSIPAADLTTGSTLRYAPGELFRIVSQGGIGKTQFAMPRFSGLLTTQQRWLVVEYVMALQGR